VVFDESDGAIARTTPNDYNRCLRRRLSPIDITGAGDAFASTMVAAIVSGLSLREALRWPPINAATTSSQYGTQSGLLRHDDLIRHLDAAPANSSPATLDQNSSTPPDGAKPHAGQHGDDGVEVVIAPGRHRVLAHN